MKSIERRLETLTAKVTTNQRGTLSGIVALIESGKLGVQDLSDSELERIIAGLPGDDADIRHLSNDELTAIINS